MFNYQPLLERFLSEALSYKYLLTGLFTYLFIHLPVYHLFHLH